MKAFTGMKQICCVSAKKVFQAYMLCGLRAPMPPASIEYVSESASRWGGGSSLSAQETAFKGSFCGFMPSLGGNEGWS